MKKRDYQIEADAAVLAARERGVQTGLVVLPTGLGKTVVLSGLPQVLEIAPPDVTLIVAHRDELIDQTVEKIRAVAPDAWVEVEKAERVAGSMAHIVVASVQTLQGKRVDRFFSRFHGRIRLFVIDEAHHATAKSYVTLIDRVLKESPNATVVGFTATPQRGDKVGLGHVFQEIVYSKDVKWAMHQGYLVPPSCYRVTTTTSLQNVGVRAGDFAQGELAAAVNNDRRNDEIVSAYLQHTPGKKAIAFTVDVAHASSLAKRFNAAGVTAAFASGDTPKEQRREILAAFKRGEIGVLCNCALWTEGFDDPSTTVMLGARPTKSPSLYAQMAGRVLRPDSSVAGMLGPETTHAERRALIERSVKPEAIIMDFVDVARKHTLVTFPGLWGLPPSLNPQGKRIQQVERVWNDLAEKNPTAARAEIDDEKGLTFEQLETMVEKIDPFAIPPPDPFAAEHSDLTWNLVEHETYRLRLPERMIAFFPNGEPVRDWFGRQRHALATLQERGVKRPSDEQLYAEMGIDVTRVAKIREEITLSFDALGKAQVVLSGKRDDGSTGERLIAHVADLPDAFRTAERWIAVNRPAARKVASRSAPWRLKGPTEGQKGLLTRLGVPADRMPETMGDATTMIEHLLKQKREKRAAKRVAEPV